MATLMVISVIILGFILMGIIIYMDRKDNA